MTTSNIQLESEAIMRGEKPGAAMRQACEDFERFWQSATGRLPKGQFVNLEIEERCKRIARLAFLEGRGL